jgi:hypothetical protein
VRFRKLRDGALGSKRTVPMLPTIEKFVTICNKPNLFGMQRPVSVSPYVFKVIKRKKGLTHRNFM